MGRIRDRTFTGCWKCRQRKVKCDEGKPECSKCRRIGITCTGYEPRYIWLEGGDQVYKSTGRCVLDGEKTWEGFQPLSSDLADQLIAECDSNRDEPLVDTCDSMRLTTHNPFSVFPVDIPPCHENPEIAFDIVSPVPRTMSASPDCSVAEKMLFHHYVTHVANIMMPYDHPRNPWQLHYPATALSRTASDQQALYSAMLAQAAFNLAHLRGDDSEMMATGSRHHRVGIEKLLHNVNGHGNDYGALSASIMTIMFSEIYSGRSSTWRHHLDGAWSLFKAYRSTEPWKITDFVCVSIQSLHITQIISATSKREQDVETTGYDVENIDDAERVDLVMKTPDFGFTIGASPEILDCISTISQLRSKSDSTGADDVLEDVLSRLNTCRKHAIEDNAREDATSVRAQSNSFIHATYIYLYRTVLDVPPKAVRMHVSKTLKEVLAFFAHGQGNFSIWPAFIAAAEAYTVEDMAMAGTWLDWATSFGIGSRVQMRQVVEEVWRRRESLVLLSGLQPGMITIDWRELMHELGFDILLI
ncbi:fungal-specific transcription factor domain-containing protein [Xylariaceae sp. FL1272]|nr:fungal-specific transcription factor domain-containing protein [Xylariaceae sp. FL1272]